MYSPWKLLRGNEDWELYQQHIISKQLFGDFYVFEGAGPENYPCLVQTISKAPRCDGIEQTIHRQFFVYVNEAQFLIDFFDGKIE